MLAGTPKEIVGVYTDLTGKPPVPPEWAFGLWASTCFVKFTEASVLETARRLRQEGIPCDVFHLDSFWQRAFMWCDFEWDAERLPDPRRLMAALHQEGFRNCLWINPYVSCQSALYQEGVARGHFLRRPDGSVYDALVWSQRTERGMGLCAIVDFTNPEAVRWYRGLLDRQLALGADSFKPDFAEDIPEDARFANGLTGAEMHNPYPLLFQRESFEATQAARGPARGRLVAERGPRRPALSRPLGRRLRVHVPRHGQHAARRPRQRDERARLLEPRHRRLLGRPLPRALRPLGAARVPLGAQPVPRRDAARPLAVRRGGARRSSASTRGSGASWCRTW